MATEKKKPAWAVIHSVEGAELEALRRDNKSSHHGEWVHKDRFRYYHQFDGRSLGACGTKYDPQDNSNCAFCQAYKYGRTLEEAEDIFGTYRKEAVIEKWKQVAKMGPDLKLWLTGATDGELSFNTKDVTSDQLQQIMARLLSSVGKAVRFELVLRRRCFSLRHVNYISSHLRCEERNEK